MNPIAEIKATFTFWSGMPPMTNMKLEPLYIRLILALVRMCSFTSLTDLNKLVLLASGNRNSLGQKPAKLNLKCKLDIYKFYFCVYKFMD